MKRLLMLAIILAAAVICVLWEGVGAAALAMTEDDDGPCHECQH